MTGYDWLRVICAVVAGLCAVVSVLYFTWLMVYYWGYAAVQREPALDEMTTEL